VKILQHLNSGVEINHRRDVLGTERAKRIPPPPLERREVWLHARAGIDQQRQRERQAALPEERDLLRTAVFEDLKVLPIQIGSRSGAPRRSR
jgi:hypothetical protein